jgi:hypothetical protein
MEGGKSDRFFHILKFLHFYNSTHKPNRNDENQNSIWYGPWNMCWILQSIWAFDVVQSFFFLIFKHYIPNKKKCFGISIYKLYDLLHLWHESTLGKGQRMLTHILTDTHTMKNVTRRVEEVGHKLHMHNFFIFNSYIILSSCSRKTKYKFCLTLIKEPTNESKTGSHSTEKPRNLAQWWAPVSCRNMGALSCMQSEK